MTAPLRWSGREARLLREVMRMSIREFAAHLGYNDAAVSSWERRGEHTRLRAQTQRDLAAALRLAGEEVREGFQHALHRACAVPPGEQRPAADADAPTAPPESFTVQVGRDDLVIRLDQRALRHPNLGVIVEAFASRALLDAADRPAAPTSRVPPALETEEILEHLRDQWHALVRTDNLMGPRHALAGVHSYLAMLAELMPATRGPLRRQVVGLAARYAESAAWLHEDAGEPARALVWTGRAMDWAHEADDVTMLAWTAYRRSQLTAATGDAERTVGLARTARRGEQRLAGPLRAAARVQEAVGHAMAGEERAALRLLDEAYAQAADDRAGDARGGHGSFCNPAYVESSRAACLALLERPRAAIDCYERSLPLLPVVYRRDRAAALAGKAAAYLAAGEPELAAATARTALPVARRAGSRRIVTRLAAVGHSLAAYRHADEVTALLAELAEER